MTVAETRQAVQFRNRPEGAVPAFEHGSYSLAGRFGQARPSP
jgi:hypothetical protein